MFCFFARRKRFFRNDLLFSSIRRSALFTAFALLLTFSRCIPADSRENSTASAREAKVEQVAREYFATFGEREDWEKLLSFYRYDMQFEDISLQVKIFNKEDFKDFYNWPSGDFRKYPEEEPHLVLRTLVVNDSVAVGRGYFNPFFYNGEMQDWKWGSEFTIWLYFDEKLKIKRQVDFIEYPDWILEDVIKRYREAN